VGRLLEQGINVEIAKTSISVRTAGRKEQ